MKQQVYSHTSNSVNSLSDLDNFTSPLQQSALDELVHELRQPLSIIESLAYFLELTSEDDKACRHLQQIQAMVLQANQILYKYREA